MKTKGLLVVGKNGSMRVVKSLRNLLGHDEIAVSIAVEIPDEIPDEAFKPMIHAEIRINKEDVTPFLIDAGRLNKLSESISHEFGLNVKLTSIDESELS